MKNRGVGVGTSESHHKKIAKQPFQREHNPMLFRLTTLQIYKTF